MKKINKKTLILTSIITLIPIVIGLLFWSKLPDTIPTHFGMDGRSTDRVFVSLL